MNPARIRGGLFLKRSEIFSGVLADQPCQPGEQNDGNPFENDEHRVLLDIWENPVYMTQIRKKVTRKNLQNSWISGTRFDESIAGFADVLVE
jgi:hypothetical protein